MSFNEFFPPVGMTAEDRLTLDNAELSNVGKGDSSENFGGDVDTLVKAGMYFAGVLATNKPLGEEASNIAIYVSPVDVAGAQIAVGTNSGKMYYRTNNTTGWTPWKTIAVGGDAVSTADANTLIDSGWYSSTDGLNFPPEVTRPAIFHLDAGGRAMQIMGDALDNTFYWRHKENSAYKAWMQVASTALLNQKRAEDLEAIADAIDAGDTVALRNFITTL
jgi:hypothetical protein